MFSTLRRWVSKRWYPAWLSLLITGVIASVLINTMLASPLTTDWTAYQWACVGVWFGAAIACVATALAALSASQVSPVLRFASFWIVIATGLLTAFVVGVATDATYKAVLALQGRAGLCGSFLCLGTSLAAITLMPLASKQVRRFAPPRSQAAGVTTPLLELQLTAIMLLATACFLIYVIEWTEAHSHGACLRLAVFHFSIGFASTFGVRWFHVDRTLRWRRLVGVIFVVPATYLVGDAMFDPNGTQATPMDTSHNVVMSMGIVGSWVMTSAVLVRTLQWSGWRFSRRRVAVPTLADGSLNESLIARRKNLIAQSGLVALTALVVAIVGLGVPLYVPAIAIEEIKQDWHSGFYYPGYSYNGWDTEFNLLSASIRTFAVTGVIGFGSALIIVAVHHLRGLVSQTLVSLSIICIPLSLFSVTPKNLEEGLGICFVVALPIVIATRLMRGIETHWTKFRAGAVSVAKWHVDIRSIMLLTLLVGIEIQLLRTIADASLLPKAAIAFAVALYFHLIVLLTIRRSIGGKTWLNLFGWCMLWLLLLVGSNVSSYLDQDESYFEGNVLLLACFGGFWVSMTVAIPILVLCGWHRQSCRVGLSDPAQKSFDTSFGSPRSACEAPTKTVEKQPSSTESPTQSV